VTQRARGPEWVTQRAKELVQSISSLTQRPGGLTQSLREALEGFSWSRLAEHLLPKRGITARLISLSGEPVWHPVVLKKVA